MTQHFSLDEFLPPLGYIPAGGPSEEVRANILRWCTEIGEPLRVGIDAPVVITSAWRPQRYNAIVGGAVSSDHVLANAVDFYVQERNGKPWELMTIAAARWIVTHLDGKYGQIIVEDHRLPTKNAGKLWVHCSNITGRHPGIKSDRNRLLVSYAPGKYEPWTDEMEPLTA